MKSLQLLVISVLACIVSNTATFSAPTTQPMPLPTMQDLQQMHDAGAYRHCLQQIARVMMLGEPAAKPYDKFALLLIRGDCLLHLGDTSTALDAYAAAEKSDIPAQAADARAMAVLIRHSIKTTFTPADPPGAKSLDIVNHDQRRQAMLDLMKQLQLANQHQIDLAAESKTLVPIFDAAPTLLDILALDVSATGANKEIHPILARIGDHARELIINELATIDGRISGIERIANSPMELPALGGYWWSVTGRRGLTTDDRESLRNDGRYAEKLMRTAAEFRRIARHVGSTGVKWDPIIEHGTRVMQHASDVLAAE